MSSYKDRLEERIEELEQQLAYECECNKQFVETQRENEKYRSALMAIEIHTTSLGGTRKDMVESLLSIDEICRDVLDK